MSEVKTAIRGICAALICLGSVVFNSAAQADPWPQSAEARVLLFSECAGRFSAQMEHDWLLGRDDRASRGSRGQMLALLDALGEVPGVLGSAILAHRIESKMAQAALLSRATFQQDRHAARLARHYLSHCQALIPEVEDVAAMR